MLQSQHSPRERALGETRARAVGQLKRAGYSAEFIKNGGYHAKELLANNLFSVHDLQKARFPAQQLMEANVSPSALKEAFGSAAEMRHARFNSKDALDAGFSIEEINRAGYEPERFKKDGIPAAEVAVLFQYRKMKQLGYLAADLRTVPGVDAGELKRHNFNAKELKKGGFTVEEIQEAGFVASEAKQAGFGLKELLGVYNYYDLKYVANFKDAASFRQAGVPVEDFRDVLTIYRSYIFDNNELHQGGYQAPWICPNQKYKHHHYFKGGKCEYCNHEEAPGKAEERSKSLLKRIVG